MILRYLTPLFSRMRVRFQDKWTLQDAIAAKVVDRTDEGLIINGAFMMATQAATSDEILFIPPLLLLLLMMKIHLLFRLLFLMIYLASL